MPRAADGVGRLRRDPGGTNRLAHPLLCPDRRANPQPAQAEEEGLDRIFKDAGFEWRDPGCSMCLAMNADRLEPGERCASTSNRNFEGRQGYGGRTHLVSPAMAAAAAIYGHFVDISALAEKSPRAPTNPASSNGHHNKPKLHRRAKPSVAASAKPKPAAKSSEQTRQKQKSAGNTSASKPQQEKGRKKVETV